MNLLKDLRQQLSFLLVAHNPAVMYLGRIVEQAERHRQHAAGTRHRACQDADLTLEAHVSLADDDRMSRLLPGGDSALEDARAKVGQLLRSQPRTGAGSTSASGITGSVDRT